MDKVFRRFSTTSVPLCFECQVNGLVFPDLPEQEFEEAIVTFNRSGQFENYSTAHKLAHSTDNDGSGDEMSQVVSNFEGEKLYMFSTLYSERGKYHTKYGEIGVFLRRVGAEKYTRAGKIKLELNKFGTGKTLELNALFSHKSLDHNIDISKAMMKFSLTAMTREQANEIRETTVPRDTVPDVETETNPSEVSEELESNVGDKARSVVNEDGTTGSPVFCYVFC